MNNDIVFDEGSFRDPDGMVFYYGNNVYRSVSIDCYSVVKRILQAHFFNKLVIDNNIITTSLVPNTFFKNLNYSNYVLQHDKILFITYPYEWSFYMLKEAALLVLNILKESLENNFILKDGTAWNLTFFNGKMCFFDVMSIGEYKDGQAWDGYLQFCNEFLYPLLIKSYKNIDFQTLFKGSLNGITTSVINSMFTFKDWFKKGIFRHVFINSKFAKATVIESVSLKNKFYLDRRILLKLVANLESIIEPLLSPKHSSLWSNYVTNNTYTAADTNEKMLFISNAFNKNFNAIKSIIDLGCNTGEYSLQLGANNKELTVFSCDLDNDCIDHLYAKIKSNNYKNIYPFVLDLMNPSSICGWGLKERKSILQRIKADAFLALALIHHICIACNVPIESFIKFLSSIAYQGILEWVDKQDPMVQFLLRNRKDIFYNYEWDYFVRTVNKYFKLAEVKIINNGTRKLCMLLPL